MAGRGSQSFYCTIAVIAVLCPMPLAAVPVTTTLKVSPSPHPSVSTPCPHESLLLRVTFAVVAPFNCTKGAQ